MDLKRPAVLLAGLALLIHAQSSGPGVILGVLEERPSDAGGTYVRTVRMVFEKRGQDWVLSSAGCSQDDCLKNAASKYPGEIAWTIAFDGRHLGQVTTRIPDQSEGQSRMNVLSITGAGPAPTVGNRSAEFSGQLEAPVYRPLVAVSQPYFNDPDRWKPFRPSAERISSLRQAFRKQFPKLCRISKRDNTVLEPYPYASTSIHLIRAYASLTGWTIARLQLEAIDCKDTEAGFDIDDPWFVVDPQGSVRYLESGLWLVDAGDYDNDGKSELLFSINRDNRGGYEIFYDNFQKRTVFAFSYH